MVESTPLYQLVARGEIESYLDAKQQTVSGLVTKTILMLPDQLKW